LEVPTLTLKEVNWAGWETLTSYFQSIAPYETEVFLSMKGNKLFEFQDFCNSWQDKLKTLEKNQQTLFIAKELELFKNIFPLLKQLSTNKDRAADKIKLREFLNVAKLMSDKANEIRELVARAQG
jgi:hypothetical protein